MARPPAEPPRDDVVQAAAALAAEMLDRARPAIQSKAAQLARQARDLPEGGWLTDPDHRQRAFHMALLHQLRELLTQRVDEQGAALLQQTLREAEEGGVRNAALARNLQPVMKLERYGLLNAFGRRPWTRRSQAADE